MILRPVRPQSPRRARRCSKLTGRVDVDADVTSATCSHFCGQASVLDDQVHDGIAQDLGLVQCRGRAGWTSTTASMAGGLAVFVAQERDLALGVGTQPGQGAVVLAQLSA